MNIMFFVVSTLLTVALSMSQLYDQRWVSAYQLIVQVLLYTQIFNIQVIQLIVSHLCFLFIHYTTVKRQHYAINLRRGMAWHKTSGALCMI